MQTPSERTDPLAAQQGVPACPEESARRLGNPRARVRCGTAYPGIRGRFRQVRRSVTEDRIGAADPSEEMLDAGLRGTKWKT